MDAKRRVVQEETRVFAAVSADVTQAIAFVANTAKAAGCSASMQNQLSICVDEVFANIASYAYEGGEGSLSIQVTIFENPAAVQIVFKDKGVAFNVLDREDPDIFLSVDQRQEGGLGIFITKKMMDEVRYQRVGGYNVLTMLKGF